MSLTHGLLPARAPAWVSSAAAAFIRCPAWRIAARLRSTTPFGAPSDSLVVGVLDGVEVAFLPRHGRGHRISPTALNVRANIWALKSLGVEWVLAVSAVGSIARKHSRRSTW